MEHFLLQSASWSQLLLTIVVLVAIYILLRLLYRLSRNIGYWPAYQRRANKYLRALLLLYEPVATVVVVAVFVLISPMFHGVIVGVIIIGGVSGIRNYFSGRVLLWDATLIEGLRIITGDKEGVVQHLGRVGLRMKSNQGLQYLSYTKLLKEGYLISSGEYSGGTCLLNIEPQGEETLESLSHRLKHLLASSPYIDPAHKPEINISRDMNSLDVRVLVRHTRHQQELISLIRERGFAPTLN